ncbi:MAG: terminase large subunit [Oscillospiraceae bacterium]|nr:terminase large subunit [Oscillospiraceae bacterium]
MPEVLAYAREYAAAPYAHPDTQAACRRFLHDLEDPRWDFDPELPEFLILTIESLFVHQQGEDLSGLPLRNKPFLLQPWQKFVCYNIGGFYLPGTRIRRFQEAFLMLARKNGKTPFATALIWAMGLWYADSGAKIKTVSGSLKQGMEGFGFLSYNLHRLGMTAREDPLHGLRTMDSSLGHSFSGAVSETGYVSYDCLAYKPDVFDAFNANLIHLDELELYKNSVPYSRLKDATIAYANRLILATTTAGDDGTGFCAQRVAYCSKIVQGTLTGPDADRIFVFIARAPQDDRGEVDYLNPDVHRMANPSWGVTVRPEEIMAAALQALNDPQTRKEFLSRRLNVFVSSLRAYFDLDVFRASDSQYSWTIPELAKLPIRWYGGSDLARLHDLTAGCLVGEYKEILIILPHCWFPIVAAAEKADKDQIPLFGWRDDKWLDMSNDRSTNLAEIVKWYCARRDDGFRISKVGHDRKFAPEYVTLMKKARFTVVDQPQLHYLKSQGFRHIEKKALNGQLYYCHAEPFEYCVGNVYAVEKEDDVVVYDKIDDSLRIDVFDASVFATTRLLIDTGRAADAAKWLDVSRMDT